VAIIIAKIGQLILKNKEKLDKVKKLPKPKKKPKERPKKPKERPKKPKEKPTKKPPPGGRKDTKWEFGQHKSKIKWENQMKKRGWTEEEITSTIKNGERSSAPNKVNPQNEAARYQQGDRFVVRDEVTREILQVSDDGFIPNR
jgi:outer membrane biosynthesis protein TonB